MKMQNVLKFIVGVFASAVLLTSNLALAEATLPQVSQAIQSGQLAKADAMMKEVLQNHPNSAKAHYIAAELYVREGKLDAARSAFVRAENLAPGLPFAQAESVQKLQAQLRAGAVPAPANTGADSILSSPLFWILIAILIAGVVFFMKNRNRPTPAQGGRRRVLEVYPQRQPGRARRGRPSSNRHRPEDPPLDDHAERILDRVLQKPDGDPAHEAPWPGVPAHGLRWAV